MMKNSIADSVTVTRSDNSITIKLDIDDADTLYNICSEYHDIVINEELKYWLQNVMLMLEIIYKY